MKSLCPCLFMVVAFLCGCSNDDDMQIEESVNRTTIVYMMAENSLSQYSQSDINEMITASDELKNTNHLLVYLDKANTSGDVLPILLQIKGNDVDTLKVYPEQDSCNGEVFASVLKDSKTLSPADSYSLVMWSHGSGWLPAKQNRTIGIDNNQNTLSNDGTEMEIATMREAIESVGLHFDWILFDACFMQTIETAYELKDLTDYTIGCPAEIPGLGAPYSKILPYFFIADKELSAKAIAECYYDYYKDGQGVLISVIKASELENLVNATSACFDSIPNVDDAEGIQQYCPWDKITGWQTEFYDMASLMYHKTSTSNYLQWRDYMEKAIPVRLYAERWTTEYGFYFDPTIIDKYHYSGVSMFLPAERYEEHGYNEKITETRWWQKVFGE